MRIVNNMKTALLATVLLVWGFGCSNGTNAAQIAINTTAKVLVAADASFAPQYEQARIKARETSETWQERDAKMGGWDDAAAAIIASYRWLVAAEAIVDTWDKCKDPSTCDLSRVFSCLVTTLGNMQAGFQAVGINMPPATIQVLEMLKKFGPNKCEVNYVK